MDLEGHEVSVFEGGYEYFKNNDGETHILLEVHPQYYDFHNNFADTLKKYEGIGFKVKYVVVTPIPDPPPLKSRGYSPIIRVPSDGFTRSLYQIENNDGFVNFPIVLIGNYLQATTRLFYRFLQRVVQNTIE